MSSLTYSEAKALHSSLPAFEPPVPTSSLPTIALVGLLGFFLLTFIFTALPTSRFPIQELSTAAIASLLAGGGVVALFCTVGVYV
ncbi:hypothetical protein IAT38_003477 [Cryptococcus sp. DSM 104549]